jgi:hypothetical protein
MLTIVQLGKSIDSIKALNRDYSKKAAEVVGLNVKVKRYLDTAGWEAVEKKPDPEFAYLKPEGIARDSVRKIWTRVRRIQDSAKRALDSIDKVIAAMRKKAGKPGQKDSGISKGQGGKAGTPVAATPVIPPPNEAAHPLSATPPDLVFADLLPDSVYSNVLEKSISIVNSTKLTLDQPAVLFNNEDKNIRQQESAWHEKITLAVAVLVMFLIGAPLGSIIRKGGIGLPLVFAVIFFVIFFLLNNFGKKFVSQAVLSPVAGMWMATYVLTPIGLFLTYKALNDSQLFNKEFYFRISRNVRSLIARMRSWKKADKISVSNDG